MIVFFMGDFGGCWWATPQLGFFIAAWSGFHWGEFAVTAGWNLEKCSVDCEW
jgi:protein-S-isoprenylcysteine O-methyltransferase